MEFKNWLEQKYLEWMIQSGKRQTLTAFAHYLGLSQSLVNQYLNGKITTPSEESVHKIAEQLGPEVYDVLGLVQPDPDLQAINALWHKLPPEVQNSIRSQIERYQQVDSEKTNTAPKQNPSSI